MTETLITLNVPNMKQFFTLALTLLLLLNRSNAQTCTAAGDQATYGTSDSWIGYVYDNMNFTNYVGYVNEGVTPNANFDESFGGDNVTYATNGCSINTSTFSVRYKLKKTFTNLSYTFTVGGDDGFRLSLDGGATWVINKFTDQSYTTATYTATLNGSYDLVLEYFENGGSNRISFNLVGNCIGTEDQAIYGTNNVWNGYVYTGINFGVYKGLVHEGTATNFAFDEKFGGSNVTYNTSGCSITTEVFSVRYKLRKTFASGSYTFSLGADDGYRLSLDGGATWVINSWTAHTYASTSYMATLNGTYDMVLEYYEQNGENRVNFNMAAASVLDISLISFTGNKTSNGLNLKWTVSADSDPASFEIQKSTDGASFTANATVNAITNTTNYNYTDASLSTGKSYYRLKMTDLSGKVIYSKTVGINTNTASPEQINVYPTLVTGNSVYLETSVSLSKAIVTISDVSGRVVSHKDLGSLNKGQITTIELASSKLPAGMYFLQVNDGKDAGVVKRVVVR